MTLAYLAPPGVTLTAECGCVVADGGRRVVCAPCARKRDAYLRREHAPGSVREALLAETWRRVRS